MKFIVKGSNMKAIVMSSEFEELPKSLLVEVIRTSMTQPALSSSHSSNQINDLQESECIAFSHSLLSGSTLALCTQNCGPSFIFR